MITQNNKVYAQALSTYKKYQNNTEKVKEIIATLTPLAEENHIDSQRLLGEIYSNTYSGYASTEMAEYWLNQAIKQSDDVAMMMQARRLQKSMTQQDKEKANALILMAADLNNEEAIGLLAKEKTAHKKMMRRKIFFWPFVIVFELIWIGVVATICTKMGLRLNPLIFAIMLAPCILFYRFGRE